MLSILKKKKNKKLEAYILTYNPYEAELYRLTRNKARLRVLIDTTRDMKKKEVYRKRYEKTSEQLENHLKWIKIYS